MRSLKICYKTKKLKKICERYDEAVKKYGEEMAEKIHLCIDSILAAPNINILLRFKIHKCHPLRGDRQGQYAMYLAHPYRLVFIPKDDDTVTVRIEEIIDYH